MQGPPGPPSPRKAPSRPCPASPPRPPGGPAPRLLSELLEELVLICEPGAGGGRGHPRAGLPGCRCPRPGCPRSRSPSASESGRPPGARGAGVTRGWRGPLLLLAAVGCSSGRRAALFQALSPDGEAERSRTGAGEGKTARAGRDASSQQLRKLPRAGGRGGGGREPSAKEGPGRGSSRGGGACRQGGAEARRRRLAAEGGEGSRGGVRGRGARRA